MKFRLALVPFVLFACWAGAQNLPSSRSSTTSPLTNQVSITVENGVRTVRSNGVPDHPTGNFPNRACPNTMTAQSYVFHMPAEPVAAPQPTVLRMHPFGVAINGVVFDPGAAEWWQRNPSSGWQYEPLSGKYFLGTDDSNAHVQPNGVYHYHGLPKGLIQKHHAENTLIQIGWAADGFPIYGAWGHTKADDLNSPLKTMKSSYCVKSGTRPSGSQGPGGKYDGTFVQDYEYVAGSGDLDENNGRFGPTPEFPKGTYHYYATTTYPFIPRSFKGTPDSSFFRKGPPGGPGGRGPMRRGGMPGGPPPGGPGGGPPPFGPPPGPGGFGPPPFGPPPPAPDSTPPQSGGAPGS